MKTVKTLKDVYDECGDPRNYRKKPIIIKAVELREKVRIRTREGSLYGEAGDFLIEGIRGEVYPCGREIFKETYEEYFE